MNAKAIARRVGLGKIALYGWHRPIGLLKLSMAEGGPMEQWRTELGRREMIATVQSFPTQLLPPDSHQASVLYLSGRGYWYQTIFCFLSLQAYVPYRITPIVYDDGTMTPAIQAAMTRVVPWIRFVGISAIMGSLDMHLPARQFPSLRARRLEYPHLRKLTDLHCASKAWTLTLDSDLLFFRTPEAIMCWFEQPHGVYIQDYQYSYGYSQGLMRALAGGEILGRVNVGLYGLHSAELDWERIEYNCANMLASEGANYLQEQALTAIELTAQKALPLKREDYIVFPNFERERKPSAVMHHYVGHSKRLYYQTTWRTVSSIVPPENAS